MKPLGAATKPRAVALLLATALAGCGGGGGSNDGNGVRTSAVKVAGDSLSDGGTFGAKATVQGASLVQTKLWVDVVTQALGLLPLSM
jgi:outer membrane lipase/esterase